MVVDSDPNVLVISLSEIHREINSLMRGRTLIWESLAFQDPSVRREDDYVGLTVKLPFLSRANLVAHCHLFQQHKSHYLADMSGNR